MSAGLGGSRRSVPVSGRAARTVAAAVPVVLVNGVAFTGQLAFLRAHLPWPLFGQLMMAAALESVAVFLAFQAHLAALAQDSALRLKLASYGFAVVIAALNYSHYAAPHWRPTFAAVAVALMSASSPWLWGVHSRRASRDQMIAARLIEGRAVRLGATRWLWHPIRSARVMWHATWAGITDPRQAIGDWEARRSGAPSGVPRVHLTPASPVHPAAPETRSAVALADAPKPAIENAHPRRTRNASARRTRKPPTPASAELHFAADLASGQVPSVRRIQRELHVGQERARTLRQHMERQAFSPLDRQAVTTI